MMTKKHLEFFAKLFRDFDSAFDDGNIGHFLALRDEIIDFLEDQNWPKFDKERFMEACVPKE